MFPSKECTDITYRHLRTENDIGSGYITCSMDYPLKSWERGEDGWVEDIRGYR